MRMDVNVKLDELLTLVSDRLADAGLNREHSEIVADVLTHADLRGVRSHGVMRTEHYTKRLKSGSLNPSPSFTITNLREGAVLFNADAGMGHVVCDLAMKHAVKAAAETGIAMAGVENGSHCGALSYFVLEATRSNMIGIALTQTDKCVAPYGGITPFFGTNPIAFGFPCKTVPAVILDMATSNTAYGKILHARETNTSIPDDWGLDKHGVATSDPHKVEAMTPFGGYKGYGIAMAIDILTGVLLGAQFGPHITAMYGDYDKQRNLASMMIAIDPSTFISLDRFTSQMDALVTELHSQKAGPGFDRVLVAGDVEIMHEAKHRKEGIPVLSSTYDFLTGKR